jgi:hypothetical protein
LPAPDGPVRKWKDPGCREKARSLRVSGPRPYRIETPSKRTTGTESSSGSSSMRKGVSLGLVDMAGKIGDLVR